ncbi:DUF3558 domain-containing protein [Nocardia sp. NPDC057227]|uniref:DUF3558 domain-containing protein n=1 Tax=Nocardia sp. NPDC057227 TaxID=3346056 RepID=UPI00363E2D23
MRFGTAALAALTVFAVAGCDSSGGEQPPSSAASATSSALAQTVPTGFRPCDDIPADVLESERLRNKRTDDNSASGGVIWSGCAWTQPDGYAATIQTTNITVDLVRGKKFTDARELDIGGRQAISTRQVDAHPEAACTVNLALKGGSLEVNLSNPPSRKNTGNLDTCELAKALVAKIAPVIPTGA